MKINKLGTLGACTLALFFTAASSYAAVSVKEADRLKSDLTPLGGERAGNGSDIPPWRGGLSLPPPGYTKAGQKHIDPFPQDKPLVVITAQNMKQYEKYLTEGQKGLFKAYPNSFTMPIYKTRRTAAAPEWVYENTYKNAIRAELVQGGNGVEYAFGGIAFPIVKNGVEAVWNHLTRWRGVYLTQNATEVAVQPNGNFSPITVEREIEFNYYRQDKGIKGLNNTLFYYISTTKAPARLAGGAILLQEPLNQMDTPRQAWGYNAGQRRVRLAPNITYDTPIAAADGLRYVDETDIYSGSPDRYNWKLLGKKEMYIPYNNYRLKSGDIKYKELLQPGHINPEYTRYEKHRVWVVEGVVKSDVRHSYGKRVFYLDEDTWSIVATDIYDNNGNLWRTSMAYMKTYYEVPATWSGLDVFHDLLSKRYHVQLLDNEETGTVDYSNSPPGERYFTPAELRRRGKR